MPDTAKSMLRQIQSRLPKQDSLRLAPSEQIHLTLRFLGAVTTAELQKVQAAAQSAAEEHEPVSFEVRGVGAFPNESRPRVIWAGVHDENHALASINGRLTSELIRPWLRFRRQAFQTASNHRKSEAYALVLTSRRFKMRYVRNRQEVVRAPRILLISP